MYLQIYLKTCQDCYLCFSRIKRPHLFEFNYIAWKKKKKFKLIYLFYDFVIPR